MTKTTRPGTVYRSRSHDRHLTRRYISGIGTGVMTGVGLLVISALLFPGWWLW